MPRKARIDGIGAVHHIVVRGIERRRIFDDDDDRKFFLDRLALILEETKTACYAWALIPNHFHLLLRTGASSVTTVMRRLLTGYAQYYNRRHNRRGHLFQNRYKSILCEEEKYLLELVRYIHLNPLRAGLVRTAQELESYKYGGHSEIISGKPLIIDVDYVLLQFGKKRNAALRNNREFLEQGVGKRRTDLTGGGLIRSSGGWETLLSEKSKGFKTKSDERILGGSEFVERILTEAEEAMNSRLRLKMSGYDINKLAHRVKELLGINPLESPGRYKESVKARRVFCYWGARELGIPGTELARLLKISQPAVCKAIKEGEAIINKERLSLE
jgi:REP element-mobilizing transposase RayT